LPLKRSCSAARRLRRVRATDGWAALWPTRLGSQVTKELGRTLPSVVATVDVRDRKFGQVQMRPRETSCTLNNGNDQSL
jgi:hypothetical protein